MINVFLLFLFQSLQNKMYNIKAQAQLQSHFHHGLFHLEEVEQSQDM